ncbi:MAG: hypothetical protein ACLFRA_00485 [Alphaproteobacteria bacterium]
MHNFSDNPNKEQDQYTDDLENLEEFEDTFEEFDDSDFNDDWDAQGSEDPNNDAALDSASPGSASVPLPSTQNPASSIEQHADTAEPSATSLQPDKTEQDDPALLDESFHDQPADDKSSSLEPEVPNNSDEDNFSENFDETEAIFENEFDEAFENEFDDEFEDDKLQDPDLNQKQKKRFPVILLVFFVVLVAVGATLYNTFNFGETDIPVINLGSSTETLDAPDAYAPDMVDPLQIDQDHTLSDEMPMDGSIANEPSIPDLVPAEEQAGSKSGDLDDAPLTPFPRNLDEQFSDLPPLQDDIEEASVMPESQDNVSANDVTNPFTLDEDVNEDPLSNNFIGDMPSLERENNERPSEQANDEPLFDSQNLPVIEDKLILKTEEAPEPEDLDHGSYPSVQANQSADSLETDLVEDAIIDSASDRQQEQNLEQSAPETSGDDNSLVQAEDTPGNTLEAPPKAEEAGHSAQIDPIDSPPVPPRAPREDDIDDLPETSAPQPKWQIRAIQPGRAVLYDAKSGNIEAIETGNSVDGLGRVMAITKQDGRWVVIGSNGKVSR